MSLRYLLALLLAFLRPAVGDPEDPPVDPKDPPADPDPDPDLELDPADPDPDPQDEPNAELEAVRKESRENKERAEKFEREAADLRTRYAPQPNDELSREEARFNDPATPALEKWQITANRELRANRSASQMALAQAHDVSDRTAFTAVAMADPLAKKYEARVEQELVKVRGQGGNASRESIYTYLLGKDMREGKFKKKTAPAPKEGADQDGVKRGKLPGARSDVNAKGATTEREKRRARLANVQI